MKVLSQKLLLPIILLLCYINSFAQQPQLKIAGGDSASVSLSKMKVEVKVIGNYAITTMEMVFCNSTSRILEGELTFPMPEGVSVSRYAIDINGKMREAVPVEKEKGQVVFENIVRRNVDPGLLERTEGNNFKTRIYPIPANGCRTIIIGYEQLLTAKDGYSFAYNLPLHFKRPLANFDFAITVASNYIPEVGTDCNTNLKFEELNKIFTASVSKKDFMPDGAFSITIPKTPDAAEVSMQEKNGQYYFLINTFPEIKKTEQQIPDRITLIWDASLSGLKRDHKKELDFLAALIRTKSNLVINLYTVNTQFNKVRSFVISGGKWDALKTALENITYDGATNFSTINYIPYADQYLFFTDGMHTFGNSDNLVFPARPVYTICAAPTADYALLKYMSAKTGGAFINLNELDTATAIKYLTEQAFSFIGIRPNSNISQSYPSMPERIVDNCSVAGISTKGKISITLQFGYGTKVTYEKTIELDISTNRTNFVDIEKIWAQKKITELEIQYEKNKTEINELGKKYGIVTKGTSLIVLDAIEDYVQYEIEPPAELMSEYTTLMKERQDKIAEEKKDALAGSVNYFTEMTNWWKKNFKVVPKAKDKKNSLTQVRNSLRFSAPVAVANQEISYNFTTLPVASNTFSLTADAAVGTVAPPPPLGYNNSASATLTTPTTAVPFLRISDEVNKRKEEEKSMPDQAVYSWSNNATPDVFYDSVRSLTGTYDTTAVSFDVIDKQLDRIYLKELKNAARASRYAKYLELRKDNIDDPVFYFSVANEFLKERDTITGYLILSNIADLNLDDHELYKMLGYKLKAIGAYSDEVNVFRKVMQWRPQDPQSYRDYALALADAGLYQNALDTLYLSITKEYDEQIKDLYPGIEEIIVTEINDLIALHGAVLNTSKIDKRLLKQTPVDIRVVLNWNMNDTDIDLWVIDPNGEKCYYGNQLTAIGGRISADLTRGYGPEHFMLKKALKGKYKIMTNYYGDSQQKIAGPTTVMAEIFTDYGRPTQKRKLVAMQMTQVENGEVLIGEFNFQ